MRSRRYREWYASQSVRRLREYPRTSVRSHSGQVSPPAKPDLSQPSGNFAPSAPSPEVSAHLPPGRPRLAVSGNDGARCRASRLTPACGDAAVDGKNHARGVTGAVRRKERHQIADLAGRGRAAERQALLKFLVAVFVAELVLGAGLQQRDVAVGADRPRIDADHADVVGEALAAECAGERHQRGIAGAAADVIGVELFPRSADVVDDHAMPARFHLRVDLAGEVDVAEHLQLPGVTPGRFVDLVDRTARNIAGIVDKDVDVGGILDQPGNVLGLAQVDAVSRGG